MKLAQKLLGHGLLIAFIVAAFFTYTNRMKLFPQRLARPVPAMQEHSQENNAVAPGFRERLQTARAHFWRWEMPAALQAYQSLAESYPERAQVWGELGNLYFNMGRAPAAMDAYARATELLIAQGDAIRALALLSIMYSLDVKGARQFEERLRHQMTESIPG